MTALTSIFGCAATDVTLERVRQLVAEALPESLTLEYKERFTRNLVDSIAAMANSYGGVILVGVSDQRALVGVEEGTLVQIVNACHDSLEPPWQPEIIPLGLGDGRFVLVVRVDASRTPRPVLLRGAAPVRLHGRNGVADRERLARLFQESTHPVSKLRRPERLTGAPPGTKDIYDFALRCGMVLPVGDTAAWRPLSDRGIDALAKALDASPVGPRLLKWCGDLGISGVSTFHREGLNRARRARLTWQAVTDTEIRHPIEAVVTLTLPDEYGLPASGLTVTLDVVTHLRALYEAVLTLMKPSTFSGSRSASCTNFATPSSEPWSSRGSANCWPISQESIRSWCLRRRPWTSSAASISANSSMAPALRPSPTLACRAEPTWWPIPRLISTIRMSAARKSTGGCARSRSTLAYAAWTGCWSAFTVRRRTSPMLQATRDHAATSPGPRRWVSHSVRSCGGDRGGKGECGSLCRDSATCRAAAPGGAGCR